MSVHTLEGEKRLLQEFTEHECELWLWNYFRQMKYEEKELKDVIHDIGVRCGSYIKAAFHMVEIKHYLMSIRDTPWWSLNLVLEPFAKKFQEKIHSLLANEHLEEKKIRVLHDALRVIDKSVAWMESNDATTKDNFYIFAKYHALEDLEKGLDVVMEIG